MSKKITDGKVSITEICNILVGVNELTAYPFPDHIIERWSIRLKKICPNITLDILEECINDMAMNRINFASSKGIQNITRAYREKTSKRITS